MDKNLTKKIVKWASIGTLCVAGVVGGYYGSGLFDGQNNGSVRADGDKAAVDAAETATKQTVEELSVANKLFTTIDDAIKNKAILPQEKLDALTYFMIQYDQHSRKYISVDSMDSGFGDASIGFKNITELYKLAGLEAPFTLSEDGSTLNVTRTIEKPASFDKITKEAKENAQEAVQDSKESDKPKDDAGKPQDLTKEVEVSHEIE